MLLIMSYHRQANTRSNSDRSQTAEASGSEPRASELTDQACIAFQLDMQVYIQQEKEYKEQDKAVQKVKSWITNTVALHYFKIVYDPTKALAN